MKMPLRPPDLPGLVEKYSDRLIDLMNFQLANPESRYLHWDELRHRPPPTGLNHEEWWLGSKLRRGGSSKPVPGMLNMGKKPFLFNLSDAVLATLHHLDSRASGRVEMPGPVATKENRDRYVFNSLVEEAITSSQLEGASTTRQVAADMIRDQRKPQDQSERMIMNNYQAMQWVREIKEKPLTYGRLMDLHRALTQGTLGETSAAGRIQQPDEKRVDVVDNATFQVLHTPPPAVELPEQLDALIEFANRGDDAEPFIHPVVHAVILHFWLAYLHPFEDGNGRTARALFYWAMLRKGYWLFEFISISRVLKQAPAKYAKAFLYTETDDNDLTYFLLHQLKVIEQGLGELQAYLQRKADQLESVEKWLKGSNLNHRQIALMSHAVRHPGHEYTVKSHETSHRVAYATARADLLQLDEVGLLEGTRRGKKTLVFIAPGDVQSRVEALV